MTPRLYIGAAKAIAARAWHVVESICGAVAVHAYTRRRALHRSDERAELLQLAGRCLRCEHPYPGCECTGGPLVDWSQT